MDSTPIELLLVQHWKELNTMRAEQAVVLEDEDSLVSKRTLRKGFLPLTRGLKS